MKQFQRLLLTTFLALVLLVSSANSFANGVDSENAFIPAGTMLAVELIDSVNSQTTFVGQTLEVKALQDYILNNVVVIEKGSRGFITVVGVSEAANWGKGGGIQVVPKFITTVNGVTVPLTGNFNSQGGSHGGVKLDGFLGLGWPKYSGSNTKGHDEGIGHFRLPFIFISSDSSPGKEREILSGTKIIATVERDTDLNVKPDYLANAMTSDPIRKQPATSQNTFLYKWTGIWSTNRGEIELTQYGNVVKGRFLNGNNRIFQGKISSNVLLGTWDGIKFFDSLSPKGEFKFTMSPDGNFISIQWRDELVETWVTESKGTWIRNHRATD